MNQPFNYELCDTEFLDLNETWHTEVPRFSPCLRDTLLIWLPGAMFLMSLASELISIHRARMKGNKKIPWNCFNMIRILLTFTLFALKASESFSYIYRIFLANSEHNLLEPTDQNDHIGITHDEGATLVISSLLAPIIQATTYLLLVIIYYIQRKAGVHTSGPIWFFLLLSVVCDAFDFYAIVVPIRAAIFNDVEQVVKLVYFPLVFSLFLFESKGDTPVIDYDPSDPRPDSPEFKASFCSNITFWWFNSFLLYGFRNQIKIQSLWKTAKRYQASNIVPIFKARWIKTAKLDQRKKVYQSTEGNLVRHNKIASVLFKIFWWPLLCAALLKLIQDLMQFITPLILKKLLAFMSSKEPAWHGNLYAMLLLILPTIQSLVLGNYFFYVQSIGLQMKTMIMGAVYRKSLVLSGASRLQSTSGQIVNLIAVDCQRFQDLLMHLNLIWSAPLQILLAIALLYMELGPSIFVGVFCMAMVLPANAYFAKKIKFTQIKVMKTKDERIKQMNEILSGIKVIKLYAWENSFVSSLFNFRNKELEYLRRIATMDALSLFLWQCSPFLVALVTFAVYVSVDESNVLDAEKAFVSISLFNLLRFPLTMLPNLVTSLVLTIVSAKRLNKFLNNNELTLYVTRNDEPDAITIESATMSWAQEEDNKLNSMLALKDINIRIKPKSFVAVVGQIASGKSSLLSAILGEMHKVAGRFNICKGLSLAYVPQQAWIQNMSVKENILFGSNFNEHLYKQIVAACSLEADLDTLPGGDESEIGEKGINLSGGQKQRVSLARACYSNSDLYLLDDPLSALDSHVAKHVFEKVLSSSTGILRNKTRVLATNSLFILPYVDQIIVLDKGKVVQNGTYKDLMSAEGGYLAELMRQYSVKQESVDEPSIEGGKISESQQLIEEKLMKSAPTGPVSGKLIEVENIETGSVDYKVYLKYFQSVSPLWISLTVIFLIASTASQLGSNLWLSVWASDADDVDKLKDIGLRNLRIIIYGVLGGLQCFTVLIGGISLSRGSVRASKRLHSNLMNSVMHSPMSFFDTTPIGRIVNRFAKDIDVVDSTIPGTFRSWFTCLLQILSTIFLLCFSFPTSLAILIPLSMFYYLIQKIFIVTSRQLKRIESTTRSPIYSHFSETLSGISCIRAFGSVDRFVEYSDSVIDRNQSCTYPNIIANRWLSVRLEFFGNLVAASAALLSVYYRGIVGAGTTGLTVSYSLNITQTLSWLVRMTSELETNIVSVERILEYVSNVQEDLWIKDKRPLKDWPQEGAIQIENYSTKYREDSDLVLKDLSIEIKPREKIGIVGRTGSGKSSLSLSMFRILEPVYGSIKIDNLNLVDIGLHDLRSKLTIIPQDPVLFSGTLRTNLDPLHLYQDIDIWRALESAHLKNYIVSLKSGLDYVVNEFGENFSVGQRQLICLARAILRKSKILILDEATASVDLETDSIVQETIRNIFNDCTIITIAHRLHTILDSDRILVLDSGQVKELDSPENLMMNPKSAFSSLAHDAGIEANSIIKHKKG